MDIGRDWSECAYAIDPLTLHSDERGTLFEALRFTSQNIPKGGQVYIYSVAPGARRGDHYHENKGEWFFCAWGTVRLLMKTKSNEVVDEIIAASEPKMIYAAAGTSHAIVNESSDTAIIVAYGDKEFDPSNPDTIMESAS